ncbi:MAG: glucosamine-6-phosphate deaminase [Candidatus Krumholzibacteria bacterium]|nr:glucosamine-6-phosphate deaminase [Candidatus Krumholzibacteria bacterium]MDH4337655.1 glucosamine-6-phosphate deaminase [Candidatus Krumholzibacteria bacterium]MDH5270265.1 glucosamine-6-phosphate deaminase [Candidatus Krumholzibacteria bacterium]
MTSPVEQKALARSGRELAYPPAEKIGVIVVDSFPALGNLAALRFIEWVQDNPEGVIALPTGRTPEHFIREVNRLLGGWKQKAVRHELAESGVDAAKKCDMRGLRFVQIDEFYPIDPAQHNSFHYYVNRFYMGGFGLDPKRALFIDCSRIGLAPGESLASIWPGAAVDLSLRLRMAVSKLEQFQRDTIERIDQWCVEYEQRIRDLGGIGFFLGGIGPDGHIGFNVRGSDLHATTRLCEVNYETQAAAATDLGGIEVARKRLVITIGPATITYNPDCTAIIMAAGEAKADIVRDAIQHDRHVRYPATALQVLSNARFYLTRGAAKNLEARQLLAVNDASVVSDAHADRIVIDLAMARDKRIEDLSEDDFRSDPTAAALLARRPGGARKLGRGTAQRLRDRLEEGSQIWRETTFLHTEPHHDDLMLGCLPLIARHIRDHTTRHYFATLTSGFTAVTRTFMLRHLRNLQAFMQSASFATLDAKGYFDPANDAHRNGDVWHYLDGLAAKRRSMQDEAEARRLYRNLVELFAKSDAAAVAARVTELIAYFESVYPGEKDVDHAQKLKGMCREFEAECLWGYFGWQGDSVRHLRLEFYTGEIFTGEPTLDRDVPHLLELMRDVKPDVITLALDPEASGPDTHYKALQATCESLKLYEEESERDITVLGYRNVWYRFHPAEADLFVPVSMGMFALQESAFLNTFSSQREASFPSPDHDGPFCELAQKIQVDQYRTVKACLGRDFFYQHPSALIRATRGLVLLKRMTPAELYTHARELRRTTENA